MHKKRWASMTEGEARGAVVVEGRNYMHQQQLFCFVLVATAMWNFLVAK